MTNGQSDEVDEKINRDSFGQVLLTASQFGEFKRFFENHEERLARLEEDITRVGDRLSDHIEPEKPVTEDPHEATLRQLNAGIKPVTEEKCKHDFKITRGIYQNDEFIICKKCGIYLVKPIDNNQNECEQCKNPLQKGIHTCNIKDDKPSEFISIPRSVAEEWVSEVSKEFYIYPNRDYDKPMLEAIEKGLRQSQKPSNN